MIYIAWTMTVIAAFGLGYYLRSLQATIQVLETTIRRKVDKPVEEEPPSVLIDPYDAVAEAKYAQERLMESLNDTSKSDN